MTSSKLFSPIRLGGLIVPNRLVVSPMCQYSAADGLANDWHLIHYSNLSMSGAGLMVIEACDVDPAGAITKGCLGIHSDPQEIALARVIETCRRYGTAAIGIQITHGGRKASCHKPWEGSLPLAPSEGAWQTVAPSAIPFATGWPVPRSLEAHELAAIRQAFVDAARRAARVGADVLEIHAAHGYLLHQFLSPVSNQRTDIYGGSPEGRMRFPLEVFSAVREVWPSERPLGIRISGTDWVDGGLTPDDAVSFAKKLADLACDCICVSSGGMTLKAEIPVGPGYQVPFAERIRNEAGITTRAVGMITEPLQAEQILVEGQADMIAVARGFLNNPRWGWHAASVLEATVDYPQPYERCHPSLWRGAKYLNPGDGLSAHSLPC